MKSFHAVLLCLVTAAVTTLVVEKSTTEDSTRIERPTIDLGSARTDHQIAQLGRIESRLELISKALEDRDASDPVDLPPQDNHEHCLDENQIKELLELIRQDVKGLGADQLDIISQILNRPVAQATVERETIINNQKVVSNLVKDVQWESTPVHEIILGSLNDLDFDVRYGSDATIDPILKAFPVEIHFATAQIKSAVKAWDRDTRETSGLLLSSGGILHLHMTIEDFANNADDRSVKLFLKENLERTHIVIYTSDIASVFKTLEDTSSRQNFEAYKAHIRLRVGPHAAALRGAHTPASCRAFVTEILRGRTFSGR